MNDSAYLETVPLAVSYFFGATNPRAAKTSRLPNQQATVYKSRKEPVHTFSSYRTT